MPVDIEFPAFLVGDERIDVLDAGFAHARALCVVEHDVEHAGDLLGDIELHGERILQRAIVGLRPDVDAVGSSHQLRGDPGSFAFAAHAAFKHSGDAEFLADGAKVLVLALELERRSAPDHLHAVDARQ